MKRRRHVELFHCRDAEGADSVHLPSLVVTEKGTAVAVCQMRFDSQWDWGHDTHLIYRRSEDGGLTWEPVQTLYAEKGVNAVNGGLVEDRVAGKLIQTFSQPSVEAESQAEWVQRFVEEGGQICSVESTDEGKT